ncbi:MAG: hypothetical protein AAFX99_30750 [Myxococcota bacterium]
MTTIQQRQLQPMTGWQVRVGMMAMAIWAMTTAVACGDDTEEEVVMVEPELEATLETLQVQVFEPGCAMSGCHDAQVKAGDLDLSSASASYAALVNVPADNGVAFENRWLRVKPGDPERSFLVRKLTLPGIGEGFPMPVGNQELNGAWMTLVRDWIEAGAQR